LLNATILSDDKYLAAKCSLVVLSINPNQSTILIGVWVGAVSTGSGFGRRCGKKRRVLRISWPCLHTGWSRF